jgi:hypothetical protein
VQPGVALAANHLVRVVLLRQQTQSGLDDATTQTQHQVQRGLCNMKGGMFHRLKRGIGTIAKCGLKYNLTFLNVVVRQGPAILQLFAGEDQPLLVGRDALLVLDLGLDILDGVRGLHLEGDGLAREGLHEDLHDGGPEQVEKLLVQAKQTLADSYRPRS